MFTWIFQIYKNPTTNNIDYIIMYTIDYVCLGSIIYLFSYTKTLLS